MKEFKTNDIALVTILVQEGYKFNFLPKESKRFYFEEDEKLKDIVVTYWRGYHQVNITDFMEIYLSLEKKYNG